MALPTWEAAGQWGPEWVHKGRGFRGQDAGRGKGWREGEAEVSAELRPAQQLREIGGRTGSVQCQGASPRAVWLSKPGSLQKQLCPVWESCLGLGHVVPPGFPGVSSAGEEEGRRRVSQRWAGQAA